MDKHKIDEQRMLFKQQARQALTAVSKQGETSTVMIDLSVVGKQGQGTVLHPGGSSSGFGPISCGSVRRSRQIQMCLT